MKIKTALTITAVIAVMILCAGCVTDSPVKTEETKIPVDMYAALDELGADLITLERVVMKDLKDIADSINTEDIDEIDLVLCEYYANNPYLTAVIYRDTIHNKYISVPVLVDVDLSEYSAGLTEQDFNDAGGLIVRDNVFTKYHGYQNLYYRPVYVNGVYHGYLVFVTDAYSLIYLHPLMLSEDKLYDNYICAIANKYNNILYSSMEESVGEIIPQEGLYDGLAYLPRVESGDGACTYTSKGYYIYDKGAESEKITAWHTIYSPHGQRYTLYLIDSLNLPELKTENVIELDTNQAVNDAKGAYIYGYSYGIGELKERIDSGYYKTPVSLLTYDGDVIASSNNREIGLNYLNTRGMYGVSFVESAIHSAEQGGGYVYYLTPAERVVFPRAAVYTLGIVMPLDKYYIYVKTAGSPDLVINDKDIRPGLTRVARKILGEVSLNGLEIVVDKINTNGADAAKEFVPDITYDLTDIAVIDTDGNVYASVQLPELVGKSATFMTDVYGGSTTRKTDILAKTGGGYMAQLYPNKDKEGYVDLWMATVEPIDTKYYVFAASVIGTFEDVLTPALENIKPTE